MVRPQPRSRHSSGHADRRTQPGDLRAFGSSAAPAVFFPALRASSGLILSIAFRPQNRPTRAAVHAPAHSPIARRVANRSCRSNRPACACPRSGCCHFVGSAGSSRLQTGTTGRAVVESSGLCSVIRLFGMPIAARAVPAGAQCDVLATAMACSSMLLSGRPIPELPLYVCLGPTLR